MRYLALILSIATLAACDAGSQPAAVPTEATPPTSQPTSIMRPEIVPPSEAPAPARSLHVVIGFPDGGADLSPDALAKLNELISAPQTVQGGAIRLAAHSDSKGSDAQNLAASKARGEAVRDWLIANGIGKDRMILVSFGEQNPRRPNALANGEPDEAGRAANRRVEITVGTDEELAVDDREPTLAEELVEKSTPQPSAAPIPD